MVDEPADVPPRGLRDQPVPLRVEEQVLRVLPQAHVDVHARAVVTEQWLGHEGRRVPVLGAHVLDDVLVHHQLVGHACERGEPHVDLRLPRGPHLVMMHFDVDPRGDHRQHDPGAQVLQLVHRRHREVALLVPPVDKLQDLRSRIMLAMIAAGIDVEVHHHEVGTAGQTEIDMRFTTLTRMADQLMMYKYIVKNVCAQHGYTATFMPKPLFGDNGSGMHVHMSLWKDAKNLFFDAKGYGLISETARWYIGGLIHHSPALLAFAAPTTNSYRRLVPGYEAPINLIYSQRNRSAICRIPVYSKSPKAKRVEFRAPYPSSNPYLTFAALLTAGLDGVKNKIEPPEPMDVDLYDLEPEERQHVKNTPGSLSETLAALEADHAFLLEGGVFTPDLIDTWLAYKRAREVDPVALRPHPYEFFLYYDV